MTSILKVDEIQNTDGQSALVITPDGSVSGVKYPEAVAPVGRTITSTTMSSYEEGTFVPTIEGTTTAGTTDYTSDGRFGYYTKVGNCVHIVIRLQWTALTGTGVFTVTKLPFTSSYSPQSLSPLTVIPSNLAWTSGTSFVGLAMGGLSRIYFYGISDSEVATAQRCSNDSASLRISGTYFTDE